MENKQVYRGTDLSADGCSETLSEAELLECRGGQVPPSVWWGIATLIISSWQDIREGFTDGVSGKPPRY